MCLRHCPSTWSGLYSITHYMNTVQTLINFRQMLIKSDMHINVPITLSYLPWRRAFMCASSTWSGLYSITHYMNTVQTLINFKQMLIKSDMHINVPITLSHLPWRRAFMCASSTWSGLYSITHYMNTVQTLINFRQMLINSHIYINIPITLKKIVLTCVDNFLTNM